VRFVWKDGVVCVECWFEEGWCGVCGMVVWCV